MPLSATLTTPAGILSGQPQRVPQVDFEGMQIAIVDADDARAGGDRRLQLVFVVHFHQRRHAIALGQFAEVAHLALGKDRGDQQNRVRAVRRGLMNVILVDGEILAQDRKTGRRRAPIPDRPRLPWKCFSSVSTDSAAAPPCS